MENEKGREKKQVTSLFFLEGGQDTLDFLEDFFLQKAIHEKKMGRVMTRNESHEFFVTFSKLQKKEMDRLDIQKDPKDVKAILSEHLNITDMSKKQKDEKGGTD